MNEYCICGHLPHEELCARDHCACFKTRFVSVDVAQQYNDTSAALIRLSRAPTIQDIEHYIRRQRALTI